LKNEEYFFLASFEFLDNASLASKLECILGYKEYNNINNS
jgi:hypothetical protein